MAQIHDPMLRELGSKLANFRRKLGDSIGEKIIQAVFGEMFGEYSPRMIETYEGGKVEIPAKLFFILWKQGNSIDALFSEGSITEAGQARARELFDHSLLASLESMDDTERGRVESAVAEANRDKNRQIVATQKRPIGAPGKHKGSHNKTGKAKKR